MVLLVSSCYSYQFDLERKMVGFSCEIRILFCITSKCFVCQIKKMMVLLQKNSFQLVITTNGKDHFIILNYGKFYTSYNSGTVRICSIIL